MSTYINLSPDHVKDLAASGITPAVAATNGIYTEVDAGENGRLLGYKGPAKKLGDCLVFPFRDIDGNAVPYCQLKPANPPPPKEKGGRPSKYLCPYNRTFRAYFPADAVPHLKDPEVPLFFTEGPKKAVCGTLNGFVTVALVGVWNFAKQRKVDENDQPVGERELIPDLAALALKDRDVFIAYDSDRAENGSVRAAERELAACLRRAGARVKVVTIPAADDGAKMGMDDYIVAHGAEKFACLVADAKPAEEDTDARPVVYATTEIHEMARRVREVLAGVPGVYARGNTLMQEANGRLDAVPKESMRELLSRHIRFQAIKQTRDGEEVVKVAPPHDAASPVFACPSAPIREVVAVAESPVMLRDGRLLFTPGYDHESKTLVRLPADIGVRVPEMPTREDAVAAANRLAGVFSDFPFVDDGDDDLKPGDRKARGCHSLAAVVSAILTVIARPAIDGPTPFFLVTKNGPGTGGSLLNEVVGQILTGQPIPPASYPNGDFREMEKLITSWAVDGRPFVNFDNIVGVFGDAELCRAITSTSWEGRILGVSKTYRGPFTAVMFGSANNASLGADMPRRVLKAGMKTQLARPEDRTGFAHDLEGGYAARHRGELLSCALTMLRAWHLAGRPQQAIKAWGKFSAWSAVVRQVCVFCGLADPYVQVSSAENARNRLLRTIATGLMKMDPSGRGMTANAIVKRLTEPTFETEGPIVAAADALAELMDRVSVGGLGRIFGGENDHNLGGIKIVEAPSRDRNNLAKWTAVRTEDDTGDEEEQESVKQGADERSSAGDAGDRSGGCELKAANSKKRSGRVQSNQYRGTPLDKEGSA